MQLLFDENLSPRLVTVLAEVYPGSTQVREASLTGAADDVIWAYAREYGFLIVSKDTVFLLLSMYPVVRPPPKVVGVRVANGSTRLIADLLRTAARLLKRFSTDPENAFLPRNLSSDSG